MEKLILLKKEEAADIPDLEMMKRSVRSRGRLLLIGALVLSVAFFGYWVGVMTSNKQARVMDVSQLQGADKGHQNRDDHDFHVLKDDKAMERLGNKLSEDKQEDSDHVYVVGEKGHRPNEPRNDPGSIHMRDHAAGIHQGHANRINQGIHKQDGSDEENEPAVTPKRGLVIKPKPEGSTPVPYPRLDQGQTHYALVHSKETTAVHKYIHEQLVSMPKDIPRENYIFETDRLPTDLDFLPSVANGYLGTRVHSLSIFMSGLFNGYMNESHRAEIPSTCSFNVTGTEPPINFTRTYRLNVGEGMYTEETRSKEFTMFHRIYAHRNYSNLLVVEIDLIRFYARPMKLQVKLNKWTASHDLTFSSEERSFNDEVSYKIGRINSPETSRSPYQQVHIFYDHVPDKLEPAQNTTRTKWVFLTAIGSSKEEALNAYKLGAKEVKNHDQLYASHVSTWAKLWEKGRIDIEGNKTIARAVYGSLYYILSAMPLRKSMNFTGISPGGLPFGGHHDKCYNGHTFWDQETWMYPTLLMLQPEMARMMLDSRLQRMDMARANAKLNRQQGARFPWESALTGIETAPWWNVSHYEVHISGDISYAFMQYLYATNDTELIMKDGFGDLFARVAEFWVSTITWNDTKRKYEIRGVMPPDEYVLNVSNSVYTNTIAQMALLAPGYASSLLNKSDTRFDKFAKDLYIPFDEELQYHPEYEGYRKGTKIKQADVVLLGYPLMRDFDKNVRANDLTFYEQVTDPTGPAMTWSMHTIGWLELEQYEKAEKDFHKNFLYIQQPFQVWTEETAGKGCRNFLTGMGGFLQSIFFGYGGFRLRKQRLDFNPVLPPGRVTSLDFIGVHYLGSTINFFVHSDRVVITLTHRSKMSPPLHVILHDKEDIHDLEMGHSLSVRRTRMSLYNALLEPPDPHQDD